MHAVHSPCNPPGLLYSSASLCRSGRPAMEDQPRLQTFTPGLFRPIRTINCMVSGMGMLIKLCDPSFFRGSGFVSPAYLPRSWGDEGVLTWPRLRPLGSNASESIWVVQASIEVHVQNLYDYKSGHAALHGVPLRVLNPVSPFTSRPQYQYRSLRNYFTLFVGFTFQE